MLKVPLFCSRPISCGLSWCERGLKAQPVYGACITRAVLCMIVCCYHVHKIEILTNVPSSWRVLLVSFWLRLERRDISLCLQWPSTQYHSGSVFMWHIFVNFLKIYANKKVLLPECQRHTTYNILACKYVDIAHIWEGTPQSSPGKGRGEDTIAMLHCPHLQTGLGSTPYPGQNRTWTEGRPCGQTNKLKTLP